MIPEPYGFGLLPIHINNQLLFVFIIAIIKLNIISYNFSTHVGLVRHLAGGDAEAKKARRAMPTHSAASAGV